MSQSPEFRSLLDIQSHTFSNRPIKLLHIEDTLLVSHNGRTKSYTDVTSHFTSILLKLTIYTTTYKSELYRNELYIEIKTYEYIFDIKT